MRCEDLVCVVASHMRAAAASSASKWSFAIRDGKVNMLRFRKVRRRERE